MTLARKGSLNPRLPLGSVTPGEQCRARSSTALPARAAPRAGTTLPSVPIPLCRVWTTSNLNCDDCGADVALPFPVTLYGQSFSTAHVGSNGHCTFGTSSDSFTITCPPPFGLGGTTEVLAPYWVDQTVFADRHGVFTTTTGSAPNRVFYIEWRSVYFGSPTTR